jgi:ADP-ribosylglycohydrolase
VSVSRADRVKGCIFGLAVGDALGAPVEFTKFPDIILRYGQQGITRLVPSMFGPPGTWTDDTQMAIATLEGCLRAIKDAKDDPWREAPKFVWREYIEWLVTQNDPRLRRAPGTTCIGALQAGRPGSVSEPVNQSEGCGGVMRTAPVGLLFPPEQAFAVGGECAALTHGHPSGYLPAAVVAAMTAVFLAGGNVPDALDQSRKLLEPVANPRETLTAIEVAERFAFAGRSGPEVELKLGEGWTGESALAISLYSILRHSADWSAAVLCAVNRTGDSDSVGAITGALLGTLLGVNAIPADWLKQVEDPKLLNRLADEVLALQ